MAGLVGHYEGEVRTEEKTNIRGIPQALKNIVFRVKLRKKEKKC